MTLHLARARLKRNAAISAIAPLLLPADGAARTAAAHRLVWSLFADDPNAKRDFLWREDKQGTFFILASRVPAISDIFDIDSKEFAPALQVDDRLRFSLRANATRSVTQPGQRRGHRADVVMAALKSLPVDERASQRSKLIEQSGATWLQTQGNKHGFDLTHELRVDGYEQIQIPRHGTAKLTFSRLDFDGVLRVTDVAAFITALTRGFGHAKAFGCGLMLIRRA